MKTLFVVAGVFLGFGTNLPAQETHILRGDDAAVVVAVVEWTGAQATELARKQGALVVSTRAFTRTTGSPVKGRSAIGQVNNPGLVLFEFPPQAFEGVEKATGLRINACEEEWKPTLQAFCGTAEPWVWMIFSSPVIGGDHAVIVLEDAEMAPGAPGTKRRMDATFYNVFLQRKGGRWVVVEAQRTGVT